MTTKWKKPKFGLDEADDSVEEARPYIYCPFTKEMCLRSPCMMWDSQYKRCLIQAAAEKLAGDRAKSCFDRVEMILSGYQLSEDGTKLVPKKAQAEEGA